ncbi:phosphoribosylanthranilate isomerase [Neobacillus sp. SM06]|uniref:phosphoribosylanthranilate isomerase n=1 Tax=Neobacillus sp. SM06 TaxID=3422492 RepID=UPI003D29B099
MKVKICGITDRETALAAVEQGADALGFVFADSKRKVDRDTAKSIIDQLPAKIMKVGVFVNEMKEQIESTAASVGLTHIQLHGEESPAFCNSLSFPVIKALSIEKMEDFKQVNRFDCSFILLDGPKGKYRGGNGTAFDWMMAGQAELSSKKIILAGGLDETNVVSAIEQVHPYMVDVSSGVETNGKKDLAKIKQFIEAVKAVK